MEDSEFESAAKKLLSSSSINENDEGDWPELPFLDSSFSFSTSNSGLPDDDILCQNAEIWQISNILSSNFFLTIV